MSNSDLQLTDLRQRVLKGEEIAPEEYSIIIDSLRRSRTASEAKPSKRRGAASAATNPDLDMDALLNDIVGKN